MNAVLLCAAAAVAPASPPLGAPRSMWRAVEAACSRGECARHSNTTTAIKNTTDCYGRLLTYDYALTAIPALAPMREAFDSLELKGCGIHPPSQSTPRRVSASNAAGGATVYVDATRGSDVNAGTEAKPVQTIAHALLLARARRDLQQRLSFSVLGHTSSRRPLTSLQRTLASRSRPIRVKTRPSQAVCLSEI